MNDPGLESLLALLSTTRSTLNTPDQDGLSALHRAGNFDLSQAQIFMLHELGAKINQQDNEQRTPLHHAVEGRRRNIISALLSLAEIDPNIQDVLKRTPLHVAVEMGDLKIVTLLLNSEKCFLDMQDKEGSTALHVAAMKKNLESCIVLLERGASTRVKDYSGTKASDILPQLEETQLLLVDGCHDTLVSNEIDERKTKENLTALMTLSKNRELQSRIVALFFQDRSTFDVLMKLAAHPSPEVISLVLRATQFLTLTDHMQAMVAAGAIIILFKILATEDEEISIRALGFLMAILDHEEDSDIPKKLSTMPMEPILNLLVNSTVPEVVDSLFKIFAKISCYPSTQEALVKKNGVDLIASTFKKISARVTFESVEFRAVGNALWTLANLSENVSSHPDLLAMNPEPLFGLVISKASESQTSMFAYNALRILVNLGFSYKSHSINLFCFHLENSVEEVQLDREVIDLKTPPQKKGGLFTPKPRKESSTSTTSTTSIGINTATAALALVDDDLGTLVSRAPSASSSSVSRSVPKAAFLLGLIKYAVLHSSQDHELLHSFLMSYRTFTSSVIILRNLLHYFQAPMSKEDHESPTTRDKILETLLTWLKRHYSDDFATSPNLLQLLATFVEDNRRHFESTAWPEIWSFIRNGPPQPPKFESYCNHETNFARAKEIIHTAKLPLTEAQAVTLAAIQFQVEHQVEEEPWRDSEISAESMEPFVKKMLPEPFKSKNLAQRIHEEHISLRGTPDNHAKHLYLKTILSLPKYGQKFYDVKLVEEAKKKQTNRTLGLGPNGLFFDEDRHHDNGHQLHIPFKILQSWSTGSGLLTLTVEGASPEAPVVYSVLTKKAEEISSLLTRLTTFARDGRDSFEPDLSLDFVECLNCRPDPRFVHLEPEAAANLDLKTLLPYAEEMARQLALLEHGYFTKISLVDVMEYARKSAVSTPGTNAIKAMIQHFNTMSEWVSSEIVKEEDNEQRVKTLSGFIQLARMCVKLRNFNGLMEILSGLNSSAVRKLHHTWNDLPPGDMALFQEFDRLMHSQSNFAEYRRTLENCPLPCLPYFGVFLTDLTFAGDGNADTTVTGKINYSKRWKMYNIVCDIERFQNTPFLFHEIEVIKLYLANVKGIEEDERYVMAQKISVSGSSLKPANSKSSKFTQTVAGLFKTYSGS